VLFELRVYSLQPGAGFGGVLACRQVRAPFCLTSVQFSPTASHVMLSYGRRHVDLLHGFTAQRHCVEAVHTALEVYTTRGLELVRLLPTVHDELNVAAWHPQPGFGIAYGTKDGRLRMLSRAPPAALTGTEEEGLGCDDRLLLGERSVDE
jgi:activator-of-BECN1-regulated-autophagy protein 1